MVAQTEPNRRGRRPADRGERAPAYASAGLRNT